jgi:MFS family permease
MLGPLLAFAILALAANAFTTVFAVAFCIALIGLGILVLLVPRPREEGRADVDERLAAGPVAEPEAARRRVSPREALLVLGVARFRALLIAAGALALATASDAFIFLVLQDKLDLSLGLFPLLFVGMTAVYMLLAVPVGRIADRIGRGRVLLGGYALLLAVYGALLAPLDGALLVTLALALMGAYYAATDGVLVALASATLPRAYRGSGLALLATSTSVGRILASVAFGMIWTWSSVETAIAVFAAGLLAAMVLSTVVLRLDREGFRADTP